MGLDIIHYKATLERPEELHPVSENYMTKCVFEEWGFTEDFEHFKDCIQLIDAPVKLQTIICVKNESELEEISNMFVPGEGYVVLFDPDLSKLEERVAAHLEKDGLSGNLIWRWNTQRWVGFQVYLLEKVPGFYFKEVGYQRKGMNNRFWTRFRSETVFDFAEQEDFDFAFSCVDYYWDNDTEDEVIRRKQLFKKYFVDQFEAGKSWMSLSY
jgi:hypothetical protein